MGTRNRGKRDTCGRDENHREMGKQRVVQKQIAPGKPSAIRLMENVTISDGGEQKQ